MIKSLEITIDGYNFTVEYSDRAERYEIFPESSFISLDVYQRLYNLLVNFNFIEPSSEQRMFESMKNFFEELEGDEYCPECECNAFKFKTKSAGERIDEFPDGIEENLPF